MSTPFSSQQQKAEPKSIPGPSVAHPQQHPDHIPLEEQEHHVNADLYRTFSPTDVAFYDWRAEMKTDSTSKPATGFLSRLFGSFTSKSS